MVTGNESKSGVEIISKYLQENPDVHIILSSGQSDTEAAGEAIQQFRQNKAIGPPASICRRKPSNLLQAGHIRFVIDQQPYVQGFYPVIALALNLRYGIAPSDIDAGARIVDQHNVKQVIRLTADGYR